jgi:CRISPR-associated protein Csy3
MSTEKSFKKLPGMLSFSRGTLVTDAEMFNEIDGQYEGSPVKVVRHGIRGTQNVNKNSEGEADSTGNTKERDVSNIQQTDTAKLDPDAEAMVVRFSFRPLPLNGEQRYAMAPGKKDSDDDIQGMRESVDGFIERACGSEGLLEVSRRFARNIASGRWLWRNRAIANGITVQVYRHNGSEAPKNLGEPFATFDALKAPLNHFNDYLDGEEKLGQVIAEGFAGRSRETLVVEARLTFGMKGAIEVYPSQNYIDGKPKGFARPLYRLGVPDRGDPGRDVRVMGFAAIRDQKVANALRTFDTWHAGYENWGRPIAVEPNGASLEAQRFFRQGKVSSFTLFKKLNTIDPDSDEGKFCIACLIRGGVYSEKE